MDQRDSLTRMKYILQTDPTLTPAMRAAMEKRIGVLEYERLLREQAEGPEKDKMREFYMNLISRY